MCVHVYINIYIYTHIRAHTYIKYIYIYIYMQQQLRKKGHNEFKEECEWVYMSAWKEKREGQMMEL